MADPRHQLVHDLGAAALRTTPPFALYAWTLNNALVLIGIISGLVNVAYVIWKWRRELRRAREIDRLMSGPVAAPGDKAPS